MSTGLDTISWAVYGRACHIEVRTRVPYSVARERSLDFFAGMPNGQGLSYSDFRELLDSQLSALELDFELCGVTVRRSGFYSRGRFPSGGR